MKLTTLIHDEKEHLLLVAVPRHFAYDYRYGTAEIWGDTVESALNAVGDRLQLVEVTRTEDGKFVIDEEQKVDVV